MKYTLSGIIMAFLALMILSSCAVNPVSGRRQLMLVSERQEIEMGRNVDKDLQTQFGLYDDQSLQRYVESVGRSLEPHVHRPHLDYHFAVLDTHVPNAFAAPGGYIYITRGLLALMNSEAELAAVLGHEIGHISARHSVARLSYGIVTEVLLSTASVVSEDFAQIRDISNLGTQLLFLRYSRQDEYEADELGVKYARSAGYSPREMVMFFHTLERLSPADGPRTPAFLSTHPLSKQRVKKIKALFRPEDDELKVGRLSYLQNIDGLVYGENPRKGMIKDGVYYYPDLEFEIQVPSRWKTEYDRGNFVLACENDKGFMLWEFNTAAGLLPNAHKQTVEKFRNISVQEERTINISGYPAILTRAIIRSGQNNNVYDLLLVSIRKENKVHTFSALLMPGDSDTLDRVYDHLYSFRSIQDTAISNVKPVRIEVKHITSSRLLRTLFEDIGYSNELWQKTAVINAMELDTVLTVNQVIKLIR